MRGVDRVPFACTYTPGTAQIGKLWPLYLTLFSTFTYSMADLETSLLRDDRAFVQWILFLAVVALILWRMRVHKARQLLHLRFDAESEGVASILSA